MALKTRSKTRASEGAFSLAQRSTRVDEVDKESTLFPGMTLGRDLYSDRQDDSRNQVPVLAGVEGNHRLNVQHVLCEV